MKIVINNKYTYPRRVLSNKTLAEKGRIMLKKYLTMRGETAEQELKQTFKKPKNGSTKTK